MKKDFISKLAAQLSESLPTHLQAIKDDFEKNCQQVLSRTFSKLDLVTREEFDVQCKVLQRTRQKLESLESALSALEKSLKERDPDSNA